MTFGFFFVPTQLIKQILNPCEKGLTVTRHDLIKEQKQKNSWYGIGMY